MDEDFSYITKVFQLPGDWWKFPGYDGEHCFASCSYGHTFPVRRCTTLYLPSCLWLSGQEVFWSLDRERGAYFLASSSPDFTPLDIFFWGFVKQNILKNCKMWMSCVTESSELQSSLPTKCLPVPGNELNIAFMCVVPLMVPIFRSTEHIRNSCVVQYFKMYQFLQYTVSFEVHNISFYYQRPDTIYYRMVGWQWWIRRDTEGSCGLCTDIIPIHIWRVWGKPWQISQ